MDVYVQLPGSCDTLEVSYSGVVYIKAINDQGEIHMSLVVAITKVTPYK